MTDFSYQLYSSRNFPPLAETLRMVAGLGYRQVEGYGALYRDVASIAALRQALDETGLTMPTGHIGLEHMEEDPEDVLRTAEVLGLKAVLLPYLQPDARPKDAAGWA
ncbi:MAG: sugar phosphate isomerase/epimerase, partial [Pseudomonadota bacterium]